MMSFTSQMITIMNILPTIIAMLYTKIIIMIIAEVSMM